MASSILMPPILEFNYPSFDMNDSTVTFIAKLSINNNLEQVDHIQVKIIQVDDGKNGLNQEEFPYGIYFIKNELTDIFAIRLNLYLNNKSIFSNSQENLIPTFYKMQVRIGYKDEVQINKMYQEEWGQAPTEEWFNNNGDLMSEWSNTSIIKTTFSPDVNIIGLDYSGINNIDNPYQLFTGTYKTNDPTENIQSYKFELLNDREEKVEESDFLYVNDIITPNISYQINSYMKPDSNYLLKLTTESTYGFTFTRLYNLHFINFVNNFPLTTQIQADNENAFNKIVISYNAVFNTIEKILIKRLSLSNNYNTYDNIYEIKDIKSKTKNIIYKDYLINSEELYIYFLQVVYSDGTYSSFSEPLNIINNYDYTYILGENGEQIIVYSPEFSSIIMTKRDNFIETIGSQYPYFQRLGTADYKTGALKGTITYLYSEQENKIREEAISNIYGSNAPDEIKQMIVEAYGDINKKDYGSQINYFLEKEYREHFINFLKDGNVKVIKSPTERLMFVRFTNANVTPKRELSRAIYDFSVNITEIFNEKNINYTNYSFGEVYEL